MRSFIRLIKLGAAVYLLTLVAVIVLAQVVARMSPTPPPDADAVVVLGSGLTPDGRLSVFARGRTLTGVDLVRAGRAPVMIVTGGLSSFSDRPVAELMAEFAARRGVMPSQVKTEPAARSTLQNAKLSVPLLGKAQHILLVTDRFHLARGWVSMRLFWDGQITLVGTNYGRLRAQSPIHEWAIIYLKEPLAIWFNLIRYPLWQLARSLEIVGPEDIGLLA